MKSATTLKLTPAQFEEAHLGGTLLAEPFSGTVEFARCCRIPLAQRTHVLPALSALGDPDNIRYFVVKPTVFVRRMEVGDV